ncbi:hypothetical protein M231_05372 [Tremella mesenterica]|uniref:Uncharacterized protein n=1 Tax=Tremella mesenterica TaxID=5217 RepID=A0A4Q1BIB0_TREME|nr:hypothetical protein M231_05372 [Tremella mesenterica]
MIGWLVNRPNTVREKQIAMQSLAGKTPVYLRAPRSKLYFNAYMVLFTVSFVGSTVQLVNYSLGRAKKVGEE